MALRTRTPSSAATATEAVTRARGLILAVFVVSGAAGLIYQVVWTRELVLLFGNTSQAVSTIVSAFMAGLGLGSLAGGRAADRSRSPLRLYGILECGIALLAVVVPFAFAGIGNVYGGFYDSLVAQPGVLTGLRFALAFAMVAPVTFLMGMTLPVISRHLVQTLDETGARLGELYAANTFGAMAGSLVAGYLLIEFLGLTLTSYVAVACNLFAGVVAIGLVRRSGAAAASDGQSAAPAGAGAAGSEERTGATEEPATAPAATAEPATTTAGRDGSPQVGHRRNIVLLSTFVSGFVSLALQVLWTRMVAEGTGSSIYIFSAILTLFLAGIGLGSAAFRRWGSPTRDVVGVLGLCLAGVGVAALATVVVGSGVIGTLPFALRAVLILLPATTLMGYAFPLAGKLVNRSVEETGGSVGILYAFNTLGSIVGSFAAAFILAATIGTNASILLLGAVNLLLGAYLVVTEATWQRTRRSVAAGSVAVLAIAALVASSLELPLTRTRTENELRALDAPVTHLEDELATVDTVGGPPENRRLLVGGVGMTSLTVDTKLMAYMPQALRPDAEDFLVIAMGMGSTYRSGLKAGMRTDVVELSPSVPSQMGVFHEDAEQYLNHPDGRVIVSDGRNYVRLADKTYDVIAVDPAPPVESAGSVVLYTEEFLEQGKERLNPGGVFLLWVPYALPPEDFRTHARTFDSAFEHVKLMLSPGKHGVYMLGSDEPMAFDDADIRAQLGRPEVLEDLADVPDYEPTDADGWVQALHEAEWLDDEEVTAFTGPGPLITDDRPLSEYFLWRRAFLDNKSYISEGGLRAATGDG